MYDRTKGNYYVYFITNKHDNVLYVGMTGNLEGRIETHRQGLVKGFTKKYNVYKLVYYEWFFDVNEAIIREKQIKNWRREKKDFLVNLENPEWKDLFEDY